MAILTEVEATDDIEFLRELCIDRGKIIKSLSNRIKNLEDELERVKQDLDSCYKSNC